ncbi:hypothetical protein FB45DRAFT_1058098 [Roridomyces roridus]|uniref:Ribosomal RNA methyltransferase FtsJ domain-containing protein n=1 Tax=Roridomyces roridus TaxID=1738132 RepID=A0AAD7BXF1_9AGAR|nr:hypothetical protein FB45DRAFT_1058098 [Roridomyces roridus]
MATPPSSPVSTYSDADDGLVSSVDTPVSPTTTIEGEGELSGQWSVDNSFNSTMSCDPPSSRCRARRELTEELIARGAHELRVLVRLRDESEVKGAAAVLLPSTPEHSYVTEHQSKVAQNASARRNRYWFAKMKSVFKELDLRTGCIPRRGPLRFLDLGCSPGGFTSYILSKNSSAQGLDRHRGRFKIFYADLGYYRLGPLPASVSGEKNTLPAVVQLPSDLTARKFDVVLLDGQQLRSNISTTTTTASGSNRLLISQLIIALQSLKKGGTLVIKLNDLELLSTAKLLYMLDRLSSNLQTFKSVEMHAARGGAWGWEWSAEGRVGRAVDGLKGLWVDTEEIMEQGNLDRLVELGRGVWEVQAGALVRLREVPARAPSRVGMLSMEMGTFGFGVPLDDPFVVPKAIAVA